MHQKQQSHGKARSTDFKWLLNIQKRQDINIQKSTRYKIKKNVKYTLKSKIVIIL